MRTCYNFSLHDDTIRISKRTDDSVVIINCGEQFIFTKEDIIEILANEGIKFPEYEHQWDQVCRILALDYCG